VILVMNVFLVYVLLTAMRQWEIGRRFVARVEMPLGWASNIFAPTLFQMAAYALQVVVMVLITFVRVGFVLAMEFVLRKEMVTA
jgi:hypothetical protein